MNSKTRARDNERKSSAMVDGFGRASAGRASLVAAGLLVVAASVSAQVRTQVPTGPSNGMAGLLGDRAMFGAASATVGDLDADGQPELAVGTPGAFGGGAVWLLFPRADATIKKRMEISSESGGFSGGMLEAAAIAALGDLDGDGVEDIAVGAPHDAFGGSVWILFLTPQGTVKTDVQIGAGLGGFTGTILPTDEFGISLASIGDLDGDGLSELAVGADGDCPPGGGCGAVWLLFLQLDGTVRQAVKLQPTGQSPAGPLGPNDRFGSAVAGVGDVNRDGTPDLAVGAVGDPTVATAAGAVWILFLAPTAAILGEQKITGGLAGFAGTLLLGDFFGSALAAVGDVDSNNIPDLMVGAPGDDDGGPGRGAVWLVLLDASASVTSSLEINDTHGGFTGMLADGDGFGSSIAAVDRDKDGVEDLVVGAPFRDDQGPNRGTVWTVFLNPLAPSSSTVRAGGNPTGFTELSPPVIGGNWTTAVDIATPVHLVSLVAVGSGPTSVPTPFGNLLIDITAGFLAPLNVSSGMHQIPIPNDIGLVGLALSTQGATAVFGTLALNNAIDIVIGTF